MNHNEPMGFAAGDVVRLEQEFRRHFAALHSLPPIPKGEPVPMPDEPTAPELMEGAL